MAISDDLKVYADDLISHLRSASILLGGVCVALSAFLGEGDVDRLKRSVLSLDQIRELRDSWSHSEAARWSTKLADCGVQEFALMTNPAIVIGDRRNYILSLTRQDGHRVYQPFTLPEDLPITLNQNFGDPDPLSRFPLTLREFEAWWNSLASDTYMMRPAVMLSTRNDIAESDFSFPHVYKSAEISITNQKVASSRAARIDVFHFPDKGMACDSFSFKNQHGLWIRPAVVVQIEDGADAVRVPIVASSVLAFNRTLLAKRYQTWTTSSYDLAFKQLKDETKDLEDVTLDEAAGQLRSELANLDREVEIGGVKFPFASLPFWGVTIIVVLQLYLTLNMKELLRVMRQHAPVRVSWLGLSSSWQALGVSLLALCVLPSTTIVLAAKATSTRGALIWSALIVSLLIAVWSSRLLISVWKCRGPELGTPLTEDNP